MHSETSAYLQVLYIAASAQSVWQALTTPADIVRYHRRPLLKIKLHPSGSIIYGFDGKPFITGKVCKVSTGFRLSHTFAFAADTQDHVEPDGEAFLHRRTDNGTIAQTWLAGGVSCADGGWRWR